MARRHCRHCCKYCTLHRWQDGKAWEQQQQTFQGMERDLYRLTNAVQSREIRVVPDAFNSTPAFLEYFQVAALGTIPLVLLDVASAIKRVGKSLDGIRSELAIANVSKIQGWGDGGFGAYVHCFVQNEMTVVYGAAAAAAAAAAADGQHRFFYIWHPDSDWHPSFEQRQREEPLGPAFGGYHHELETICLRMRADREALIATTAYGRDAVFHLVVPAYHPLVISRPIAFADELLPLVITGSRHRATDLVWFALGEKQDGLTLRYVGLLSESLNPVIVAGSLGYLGMMIGGAGCFAATAIFPPCAPAAANVFVLFWAGGMSSFAIAAAGAKYDDMTREITQILGDPAFIR